MLNRILVAIMCLCAGFAIGIGMYEGCKKTPKSAVITEIKRLRDTVYAYKIAHYKDTFKMVTTKWNLRIDSVRTWLDTSYKWDTLCQSLYGCEDGLDCRVMVVQTSFKAARDRELIGVYQAQRSEDSMQIGYLMQLDSLNSVALISTQTELDKTRHQTKGERLKQAGKIALSAIVGFIVGRL